MIVQILLGVVVLVVLAGAYFASKFWHWAHVLVLVVFFFVSVGYALLAARSLETRRTYQEQESKALAQLEEQTELLDGLRRGSTDSSVVNRLASRDVLEAQGGGDIEGTINLEHDLRMASRQRGRVWRNAVPAGPVDPQTGAVSIGFPVRQPATSEEEGFEGEPAADAAPAGPPPALGLEPDSIVYLFEQGPMEGISQESGPRQYLGEFRVEAVDGRQATLEPLDQLSLDNVAAERLLASRGPWILYESMPADSRDLFAGMDEETLRRLLPASSVQEYLRDGTPATPDDPPNRLEEVDEDGNPVTGNDPERPAVAKRYRRHLRDYTLLLNDLQAERAELIARDQAITSDIAKLNRALEGAEKIRAYREAEIAKWRNDLAAVERERAAIEKHVASLENQVANARRLLDATLEENAQLAQVRASKRGVLTPFGSGALDVDAL